MDNSCMKEDPAILRDVYTKNNVRIWNELYLNTSQTPDINQI